jgi:hypothetical protein
MLGRLPFISIAAIIACTPVPRLEAQAGINRNNFLIEPNRPLVYLHVDHFGLGAPEEDGKRHERIWLELHNNCLLPISVRTYGAPAGDSADAIGIMDILAPANLAPAKENEDLGSKNMPSSIWFDVGSRATIATGKSLLFSLPADHFSKSWDIHIPYEFDLPPGKGPRDDAVWGGTTEMFLSYSFYDLPGPVQTLLIAAVRRDLANHLGSP